MCLTLKLTKIMQVQPMMGESMNRGIVWTITLVIFLDYIQVYVTNHIHR
jgi:hypothetical protein